MIQQSIDSSSAKGYNRFALCIIVGKRARGLISGEAPLAQSSSKNAVSVAISEISENKISFESSNPRVRKLV